MSLRPGTPAAFASAEQPQATPAVAAPPFSSAPTRRSRAFRCVQLDQFLVQGKYLGAGGVERQGVVGGDRR